MHRTSIIVIVGTACASLIIPSGADAEVVFEPLQELGSLGHATSINEAGQATGFSGSPRLAVRWDVDGTLTVLGTFDGDPCSQGSSINDLGDVSGISWHEPFSNGDPVIWYADGSTQNLGLPPGQTSATVESINNLGNVILVGWITQAFTFNAYYRPAGGPITPIGSFGGSDTRARDMNESNMVAGHSKDAFGNYHAYRWEPGGSMVDLGTLPGEMRSRANAINELGEIAGRSGSQTRRAVRWDSEGHIQALAGLGTGDCAASGINDLGFVVGICENHAVIWTPEGEAIDLNDYLPANADFTLVTALDINSSFQIVGMMESGSELGTPFRLTIPEPGALLPFTDIRPGSCPNPFNRRSRGVLPVALLGTVDFDVLTVDLCTLLISRADGVGGSVSPLSGRRGPGIAVEDVATPFDGETCACHELDGDGIDDLTLKFSTLEMSRVLELNALPRRETIELVLRGSLQDGTTFEGSDCIVIQGKHRAARELHRSRRSK